MFRVTHTLSRGRLRFTSPKQTLALLARKEDNDICLCPVLGCESGAHYTTKRWDTISDSSSTFSIFGRRTYACVSRPIADASWLSLAPRAPLSRQYAAGGSDNSDIVSNTDDMWCKHAGVFRQKSRKGITHSLTVPATSRVDSAAEGSRVDLLA
jgi:hypothetical protein